MSGDVCFHGVSSAVGQGERMLWGCVFPWGSALAVGQGERMSGDVCFHQNPSSASLASPLCPLLLELLCCQILIIYVVEFQESNWHLERESFT